MAQRRWSAQVTKHSDALDLAQGLFAQRSARAIAASLKRSAERSKRRKSPPLRAAMSMLTFYINRAGKNLGARRLRTLERAKDELRALFATSQTRSQATARAHQTPARRARKERA